MMNFASWSIESACALIGKLRPLIFKVIIEMCVNYGHRVRDFWYCSCSWWNLCLWHCQEHGPQSGRAAPRRLRDRGSSKVGEEQIRSLQNPQYPRNNWKKKKDKKRQVLCEDAFKNWTQKIKGKKTEQSLAWERMAKPETRLQRRVWERYGSMPAVDKEHALLKGQVLG